MLLRLLTDYPVSEGLRYKGDLLSIGNMYGSIESVWDSDAGNAHDRQRLASTSSNATGSSLADLL